MLKLNGKGICSFDNVHENYSTVGSTFTTILPVALPVIMRS